MLNYGRKILLAAGIVLAGPTSAEEVLRGVAALPENNVITQSFLRYVEIVNDTSKDVISIDVVGGPEAIPPQQQDTALRNGIIDIQGGPAGYYKGVVPEGDALTGATVDAATARANGAVSTCWRRSGKKSWAPNCCPGMARARSITFTCRVSPS